MGLYDGWRSELRFKVFLLPHSVYHHNDLLLFHTVLYHFKPGPPFVCLSTGLRVLWSPPLRPSSPVCPSTPQLSWLLSPNRWTTCLWAPRAPWVTFKLYSRCYMIAIMTLLSRNSPVIRLNYRGFLSSDTCRDLGRFCCIKCCESVRQDFNSRHPRGGTVCVYVLILSAPLPPSAVHACCSCCSYARNLHSPVHCSACLCHHSGSKGAKVHLVFLFCSSFSDTCLWFWTVLLARN